MCINTVQSQYVCVTGNFSPPFFRGLHIQFFGKFWGLLFELSGATFSISGAPFFGGYCFNFGGYLSTYY